MVSTHRARQTCGCRTVRDDNLASLENFGSQKK